MKKILTLLASFAPALALAADSTAAPIARTVDGALDWVIYIAGRALPLLILAALVLFLFGIVKRFFWSKDAADKGEAGKYILWGIVALFVMVSVWGLVNVLRSSFNLDNTNIPIAPAIPVQQAPYATPSTNR
jgi:hypothetical protein